MTESTRRMRAAASPHKREAWQANREMASSSYRVVQAGYAWNVFDGDVLVAAGLGSDAEALRWVDRHTTAKRYGAP
jgi:hypothetical protein